MLSAYRRSSCKSEGFISDKSHAFAPFRAKKKTSSFMLHYVLWLAYLIGLSKVIRVGGKQKPNEMWQAGISLAALPHANWLCPGVPVHKGMTIALSLFRSRCLAVVYCLVLSIRSCELVHEDKTREFHRGLRKQGNMAAPPLARSRIRPGTQTKWKSYSSIEGVMFHVSW